MFMDLERGQEWFSLTDLWTTARLNTDTIIWVSTTYHLKRLRIATHAAEFPPPLICGEAQAEFSISEQP